MAPVLVRIESLTGRCFPQRLQRRRQTGTDPAATLVPARSRRGGPGGLPGLFRARLVVLTLTAAAVAIHLSHAAIRRGAAAARLQKLGPVAGVSSLLAVLLAVYALG